MPFPYVLRSGWLENQWEVHLQNSATFGSGGGWFGTQDDVETKLYGLAPFKTRGAPSNMQEAGERAVYTTLNSLQCDSGTPLYGDVTAVLNSSLIRNLTIISAIDTGEWTALCNTTFPPNPFWPPAAYHSDCGAYNFTLGTLQELDHLILARILYWKMDVPTALARQFELFFAESDHHTSINSHELFKYWEALPLARLIFPQSVKFLIGSFPKLFGTRAGVELQKWCMQRGWALVWTLGLNLGSMNVNFWSIGTVDKDFPRHGRLVDPLVLQHANVLNVTVTDEVSTAFQDRWRKVQFRRWFPWIPRSAWAKWWQELVIEMPSLHVTPLHAATCADAGRCIGVTKDEDCLCYRQNKVQNNEVLVMQPEQYA